MKFTVRKQELQEELALIQGVVEPKATIPILSHLLLRADKSGLELLATDLEIGLRTRCAADVARPGAATIPAKTLHELVRSLDCDVLSLDQEESSWLRLEGGAFRGRVAGLAAADFPSQPTPPEGGTWVRVTLPGLQQMVQRAIFAVTTENTRFSINGALLKVSRTHLTLVATDGHRLAHVARPCDLPQLPSEISVLVPRKALMEINRMRAADENEEVEIAAAGNHVFFRTNQRLLFSRTLEGTFPNYDKVIPAESPVAVTVDRAALLDVIDRVSILTSDSSRLVTFHVNEGALSVSAANPNMGEASEKLPVEHVGGEVKIGLNYEYVVQFLSVLSCEKVVIRLRDGGTQALLQPEGDDVTTYQYVVMPMRLS